MDQIHQFTVEIWQSWDANYINSTFGHVSSKTTDIRSSFLLSVSHSWPNGYWSGGHSHESSQVPIWDDLKQTVHNDFRHHQILIKLEERGCPSRRLCVQSCFWPCSLNNKEGLAYKTYTQTWPFHGFSQTYLERVYVSRINRKSLQKMPSWDKKRQSSTSGILSNSADWDYANNPWVSWFAMTLEVWGFGGWKPHRGPLDLGPEEGQTPSLWYFLRLGAARRGRVIRNGRVGWGGSETEDMGWVLEWGWVTFKT